MLKLFENKKFLLFLLLINLFVGVFSLNYYFAQFNNTNFLFWFFVADCPVYILLFVLIIFQKINEKEKDWFIFIVLIGLFKYGFWTLFILFQGNYLLSAYPITIAHILMIVQTIIFYKKFSFKVKHVILAIFWFLLNDFLDYVLLIHPYFQGSFENVLVFALLSTIFTPIIISIFYSRHL